MTKKTKFSKILTNLIYSTPSKELIKEGWPAKVVNIIQSHDAQDRLVLERVLQKSPSKYIECNITDNQITLRINLDQIELADARVKDARREREEENEFIIKGASAGCMSALFGVKKDQVVERRKLLGVTFMDYKNGRPCEERRYNIVLMWRELRNNFIDERTAILRIYDRYSVPISEIWNAVKTDEMLQAHEKESTKRTDMESV